MNSIQSLKKPMGDTKIKKHRCEDVNNSKYWNYKEVLDNVECSICCEEINKCELYTIGCGHSYHSKCIRDYFLVYMNDKCPICRGDFVINLYTFPKKTCQKYKKILTPLIKNKPMDYRKFFNKHKITKYDTLF